MTISLLPGGRGDHNVLNLDFQRVEFPFFTREGYIEYMIRCG